MSARMYGHGYHNKELRERTKKGWEGRGFANHRMDKNKKKRTAAGIPWWLPTQVLLSRFKGLTAENGRDLVFTLTCDRTWEKLILLRL